MLRAKFAQLIDIVADEDTLCQSTHDTTNAFVSNGLKRQSDATRAAGASQASHDRSPAV